MVWAETVSDPILIVGQYDLYFMGLWFLSYISNTFTWILKMFETVDGRQNLSDLEQKSQNDFDLKRFLPYMGMGRNLGYVTQAI